MFPSDACLFPQKPWFVTSAPSCRYATISLESGGRARMDVDGGGSYTVDARSASRSTVPTPHATGPRGSQPSAG